MVRRPDTETEKSSQSMEESSVKTKRGKRVTNGRTGRQESVDRELEDVEQGEGLDNGEEGEEGGDGEAASDDDNGTVSPKGKKRARVNDAGESVEVKEEEEQLRRPRRLTVLSRDVDGYVCCTSF